MKLAVQRTTTAVAAFATVGVSSLFLGTAPATAGPTPCGTGTLISTNICEQTFTSTTATSFTPPAQTSKLEALLVGAGGSGNTATAVGAPVSTNGYATGGGGGQVKIVDFTSKVGSATPLSVTVGSAAGVDGTASTITGGPAASAAGGAQGSRSAGGDSGTHTGGSISDGNTPATLYGGGAGAGGSTTTLNGGAGVTISTTYSHDPLFGSDTACYGGGGASVQDDTAGTATCGGASLGDPSDTSYAAASANTGGGGAASLSVDSNGGPGSDGVVVFRWFATNELTFNASGHGAAPAPEAVPLGTAPKKPTNPTASGFVFAGWYTDPTLATAADFSTPLTGDTTFYAKWDPALPTTGGGPNSAELPLALGTLAGGAVLLGAAVYRRRRRAQG